ncbi:MAG: response regulator transcription factor [Ignavibacteria bacterium]|nr:response regulator transcription factor [Ignavibacteria bacterium]
MKVMIVDDSEVISRKLEESLMEIEGIEVVGIAEDGLQAIADFTTTDPDIIILDLMIPKMNGLDVLRNIRLKSKTVTIIVLTNYDQSYFRELCTSLGADYFLDKSADFEKVYQICFNKLNPDSNQDTN